MKVIDMKLPGLVVNAPPCEEGKKTRILLIITQLVMGGGTKVVIDIAQYLNNHPDYEVDLISGPIAPGYVDVMYKAFDNGIRTRIVPSLVNHISPLENFKAVAAIRRIIAEGNYDIVHTHTKVAGVVGRIAAKTSKAKTIIHHVHGWGAPQEMSFGKRLLYLWLERICASFTDRMVAVCRLDIEKGLAYRIGKKEQFSLIYNGISVEQYQKPVDAHKWRAKLGLEPHTKLVGMIARLDEQKNPLDFIRAAKLVLEKYSGVQFLFVGDGPMRYDCEKLITEYGMEDRLSILGYQEDVAGILKILTLTAMSSLWEGLPIVFLESLSAGVPIVANDVDGAREVVIDGETGFLVTPRKPEEMAERILELLNNDRLCKQMGAAGQVFADNFSVQRMLSQVESLYEEFTEKGNLIHKSG